MKNKDYLEYLERINNNNDKRRKKNMSFVEKAREFQNKIVENHKQKQRYKHIRLQYDIAMGYKKHVWTIATTKRFRKIYFIICFLSWLVNVIMIFYFYNFLFFNTIGNVIFLFLGMFGFAHLIMCLMLDLTVLHRTKNDEECWFVDKSFL